MKKALVLIDYENLTGGGRNQGLELTPGGFQYFIDYLSSSYEINDGMLNLVCRFADFSPGLEAFCQSLSIETVNAIDLGKDVADGFLIVEAVMKIMENASSIDEVILVSGDNVYAGLVRTIVNKFRKPVKILSWKKGLADSLTKINVRKVTVEYPEDIFKIASSEHLLNGWFNNDDCSALEFAVISFIANSNFKNGYQVNALANKLVDSPDVRVATLNDYTQTREWIIAQTGNLDLFVKSRVGRKWEVKPNLLNTKVQYVLSEIGVTI